MKALSEIFVQWRNGVGEVQFLLAIGLFFMVNFIGSKTYSIGYVPISLIAKDDSKLAFNFALRVATPVVYIILSSSLLYYLGLDIFVKNFYFVSIYYLIFRYIINSIEGRLSLLNWGRQFAYVLATLATSYFFYDKFISIKKNLLPDFSNLANEMWIIIILFVYKIINDLEVSVEGAEKRKARYVFNNYAYISSRYSKIVNERVNNDILKSIIYAIIIYENFNRSKLVRFVENISYFVSRRSHTLGLMQVTTEEFINDEQSVIIGIRKIKSDYNELLLYRQINPWSVYASDDPGYITSIARREIISKYNTGNAYLDEVDGVASLILEKFFPNTKDTLGFIVSKPDNALQ